MKEKYPEYVKDSTELNEEEMDTTGEESNKSIAMNSNNLYNNNVEGIKTYINSNDSLAVNTPSSAKTHHFALMTPKPILYPDVGELNTTNQEKETTPKRPTTEIKKNTFENKSRKIEHPKSEKIDRSTRGIYKF